MNDLSLSPEINPRVKKRDQIKKELPLSTNIPYTTHVTRNFIKTIAGDYIACFRIGGIAHESADDEDINVWHEQLGLFMRNIASPHVAVWTHIVRREEGSYPAGEYPVGFTQDLDEKYRSSLSGNRMLVNELYLTVVYRPQPNKADKFFAKFEKVNKAAQEAAQADAIEKLEDLAKTTSESLKRYDPELLGTYTHTVAGREYVFSEPLEFLGFLVNGEWQRMPLMRENLRKAIGTSRPFFGSENVAFQTPEKTIYGAFLNVKEYPPLTCPGLFNELLTMPGEFVLTQSFTFIPKQPAISALTRQRDIMVKAGDLAESQIEDIEMALDDLVSNRFVMGNYHMSLLVLSHSTKELKDVVADARTRLADAGMVVVKEDLANEACYWAQLPCNFDFRVRPCVLTSRNFAGFSSLHNFPMGKKDRNHWGPALALLKTQSGGPYYFNFHLRDLGHTIITGPSGSGKTVLQGFLLSQIQKFEPTTVFFDKDRGAEIFVRAMRGHYQPLQNGQPTGWNPFQMENTPNNRLHLERLIKLCVTRNGEILTPKDERDITNAVAGVLDMPKNLRRIDQVLSYLDNTDNNGIYYRLARWCEGGPLAWVFDNDTDELDFNSTRLFGFDTTDILDNDEIRTPALFYLLYRMDEAIDGRRFVCFIDEFWKALLDKVFEDLAQNGLKVYRKRNAFMVFGTQSPADTLKSKIAHTIIEQCATHIFMPNPKADHDDYVKGFKLTEREYEIVKTLPEGSRCFLVKQGHNSVVCELNLRGFDDELAILSGTEANIDVLNRVTSAVGNNPDDWIPVFHRERRSA